MRYIGRMEVTLHIDMPVPHTNSKISNQLEDFATQRAQLCELISGIEAMQPQYDIPYFDLTTEETIAGLRDRVAVLDLHMYAACNHRCAPVKGCHLSSPARA